MKEIQAKAVKMLFNNHRSLLHVSPRVGKTKIAIDFICKSRRDLETSVLWVIKDNGLIKAIEKDVNQFSTSKKLKISYVNYRSLGNFSGTYDIIILDEVQYLTEKNAQTLLKQTLSCNYLLGMTGTPTKNYAKLNLYDRLKMKISFEYTINEASENKILSDYFIKVVHVTPSVKENVIMYTKEKKPYYTSESKYLDYLNNKISSLQHNPKKVAFYRNMLIARKRFIGLSESKKFIAAYLKNLLKKKTLIIAPYKEIADFLGNAYHSSTKKNMFNLFQEDKINFLSIVNTGGVGTTYRNLENLILIQCSSDTNGDSTQKICRALLKEKDKVVNIYLICLDNSQDVQWVERTLENFDSNKVKHININQL